MLGKVGKKSCWFSSYSCSLAPHLLQNCAPGGFCWPHWLHVIVVFVVLAGVTSGAGCIVGVSGFDVVVGVGSADVICACAGGSLFFFLPSFNTANALMGITIAMTIIKMRSGSIGLDEPLFSVPEGVVLGWLEGEDEIEDNGGGVA